MGKNTQKKRERAGPNHFAPISLDLHTARTCARCTRAAACQAADPGGSGLLDPPALFEAIAGCELQLSQKECYMLMSDASPSENGRIPYDNVVRAAFETLLFFAYDEAYRG